MRAAVMRERKLVVGEVADPLPGPGHVLVETLACGICGSDLHVLQHPELLLDSARDSGVPFVFDVNRDVVMGHEFCARVLELGPGVSQPQVGDVVVSIPLMVTPGGPAAVGYSNEFPGGYGERMLLMASLCVPVPDGLDPRHAALTEPMAVGLHAVNRAGVQPGEGAVVLGCGPVGLAVIAASRLAGVERIVATDFSEARRRLAVQMGAKAAVDPREEPAASAWQRLGGGLTATVFEAVGVPGMLDEAMRLAGRNARIVVVGACMQRDEVWPILGINKELSILFALGYTPQEFSETLRRIAGGELDVASLITGEVGISGTPEAFQMLANPDSHAKVLVRPALG